jgi:hypothetical protein
MRLFYPGRLFSKKPESWSRLRFWITHEEYCLYASELDERLPKWGSGRAFSEQSPWDHGRDLGRGPIDPGTPMCIVTEKSPALRGIYPKGHPERVALESEPPQLYLCDPRDKPDPELADAPKLLQVFPELLNKTPDAGVDF